MSKTKLGRRVVPACVMVVSTKRVRATWSPGEYHRTINPTSEIARWVCETCGVSGDWTTLEVANDAADAHVERVRSNAK